MQDLTPQKRIAFIHLLKRLPVNLRPLLLIKKDYNPKGLGLFLWGYAKLYAREKDPRYLEQIDRLLDLLEGLKSRDCSGNGWGYNFDWQSRRYTNNRLFLLLSCAMFCTIMFRRCFV